MSDSIVAQQDGAQLSQGMRVVDTFVAPSKTFTDILRSANCWLPLVLMFVMTLGFSYTIDRTVGFEAATQTVMSKKLDPDQLQQMPADRMALTVKITKISSYASIVFVLIFMLLEALVLWGAFNFGLGAKTRFSQVFAVISFAGLPRALVWVLSIILLFAGVGTENFDMRNPVGTNIGYFLTESPKWMQTAGQFFDVLGLWSLALIVFGMAIISKKKVSQSAAVVVGLWVVILLIVTAISAV